MDDVAAETRIAEICRIHGNDRYGLLSIVLDVQNRWGCVSDDAIDLIAGAVGLPRVQVADVVSFYSFFTKEPTGRIVIRLGRDIIDELHGIDDAARAFQAELGIGMGGSTGDGLFSLDWIPYVGVPDQPPSAMVNQVILTRLRAPDVSAIVAELRRTRDPAGLIKEPGDGNNAHALVGSMIHNNIRRRGAIVLSGMEPGAAIAKALTMGRDDVVKEIKTARLRGRGGAGFPAGMKWDFARRHGENGKRIVICNADEGEPGTFKDRVILTEEPDLMFEGMTVCAYAIGARKGILYLRAEYAYLRPFLEHVLSRRRAANLLGEAIAGAKGFNFDIRIHPGAGAYICGEETALISSCEGNRGDPKTRPPFPVEKGYRELPTVVNNVETLCCAARVIERGAPWFTSMGSRNCPGTKCLSICGDCNRPGVYEVPFGVKLREVLEMAGSNDIYAVQVGGPSGSMVGANSLDRAIGYDDLSTGGAIVVFNRDRDPLHILQNYIAFFREESCGYCTPCRVGNMFLFDAITAFRENKATSADIGRLGRLCEIVRFASRCGLGQSSPNSIVTCLEHFRNVFEKRLVEPVRGTNPAFDIHKALGAAEKITGRASVMFPRS